jgi:hypothetical protein
MGSNTLQHTCYFRLEQNANGDLMGNLVCSYCGSKIPLSWGLESFSPTKGAELAFLNRAFSSKPADRRSNS